MNRPLLERDTERERLLTAFRAAAEGETRLVVLDGAAGLGKTALLQEVARATGVPRLLAARPSEAEAGHAYGVLRQLFAALADEDRDRLAAGAAGPALAAPEPLPGPAFDASFGVLDALYWFVADLAARTPLALVVDDAHWADAPSLRFLGHLVRRLEGLPLAIVLALRPHEPAAPTDLLDPLRVDPRAEVITLRPLSEGAVGWIVGREGGHASIVPACHRACGGNPLYLRELLRLLQDESGGLTSAAAEGVAVAWPATIARHAHRRASRLGEAGARLLEAMAVLDDGAPLLEAAAVAGVDAAPARDLAASLRRMGILAGDDPVAFAHPIVRAAIETELAPAARLGLHRRAAGVLEAAGAPAERAANHLLAVPPGSGVGLEVLRRAAAVAQARGAPDAAVAYLRRVVAEPPPPGEQATSLHALGVAEEMVGDEAGWDHLRAAIDQTTDRGQRTAWTLELAVMLGFSGAMSESMDRIAAGLADAGSEDERDWLAAHLVALAWGEPEGDARAEALLAQYALRPPVAPPARHLVLAARASRMDLPAAQVAALAEEALAHDPFATGVWVSGMLACGALIFTDRFERAGAELERASAMARAAGSRHAIGAAHAMQADLAFAVGDLGRCETHARTSLSVFGPIGGGTNTAYTSAILARALVDQGELGAAEAVVSAVGDLDRLQTSHAQYFLRGARARLHFAAGRFAEAVADFAAARACLACFSGTAWSPLGFDGAAEEALALDSLGRGDEARALVAASLGPARGAGPPRNLAATLRVAGILAGGREGIARLEEAAAALEGTGACLEQARTLVALGTLRRVTGARVAARAPLERAFDLASDSGAVPLARRAREELAASGARPRRARLTAGRDALTPSEARLARMAAEGRSNRQIAQELYISLKTVEMHLGRAYRKLGIDGRAELRQALEASR